MAKNEDGEFELILGNNQLLSVFFLMVLLLALCFVGGYVVGRNAAPMLSANNAPAAEPSSSTPAPSTPAKVEIAKAEPPAKTAPQVEEPKPETKAAPAPPKETPKAEPPKATPKAEPPPPVATKAAPAQAPISSQPVAGRRYLQLSATSKDKAEVMADLVRRANLPAIAAAVPDRPDLYRVLVGPLTDDAIASTRTRLDAGGFPGTAAISKVF